MCRHRILQGQHLHAASTHVVSHIVQIFHEGLQENDKVDKDRTIKSINKRNHGCHGILNSPSLLIIS